jgi:hypothetical protein
MWQVSTGWGGWIKGFAPNLFGHERGSALFVFALRRRSAEPRLKQARPDLDCKST